MTEKNETVAQELARLRAENEALKQKAEKKAQEGDGLTLLTSYDESLLATVEDLTKMVNVPGVDKVTKPEMSVILKVFGIEPQAQYRPLTQAKGRGFHLYLKAEVQDVMKHIENFIRRV